MKQPKKYKVLMQSLLAPMLMAGLIFSLSSCEDLEGSRLLDDDQLAIYELLKKQNNYDMFMSILEASELASPLNSHGAYTLFCPSNDAVDQFIEQSDYVSLEELLSDTEYVRTLARYHLIMGRYYIDDLSYGAIGDTTASGNQLTVSFGTESGAYEVFINTTASVILQDQQCNNGVFHVIDKMLIPVVYDSYELLQSSGSFNIFCEALVKTGLRDTMYETLVTSAGIELANRFTVLAEPDSLLERMGISNYFDLETRFSDLGEPDNVNDGLYQFMAFHIINTPLSLSDLNSTNYNTLGDELMAVSVKNEIWFNSWNLSVSDTVWDNEGVAHVTTYIVNQGAEPYYMQSNMISKNGLVHTISNLLVPHTPGRSTVTIQPTNQPEFRDALGSYSQEYLNSDDFENFNWWDTDNESVWYVYDTETKSPNSDDYVMTEGLFTLELTTNKILKGEYEVILKTETGKSNFATIQCYIDNVKVGGLLNLKSRIGSGNNSFQTINLGKNTFSRTQSHVVKIEAFIPGEIKWDFIQFVPVN